MQLLLEDFSRLHGPENQIELVKIDADVASKPNQLLLNFEILPSRRRWFGLIDHTDFSQTSHHVLIKNRVAFHADVAQEVTGFLVTQSFDLLFLGQPIAPLERIS